MAEGINWCSLSREEQSEVADQLMGMDMTRHKNGVVAMQ